MADFLKNGWDAFGEEMEKEDYLKDGQRIHTFQMDNGQFLLIGSDGRPYDAHADNGLNSHTRRPKGDDRSADDIIGGSPVLSNLSSEKKQRLKEKVGDFENDADAAFRAEAVLNRIERYNNDGSRILNSGGDAGNGKIDGYWMKKNGGILFVFNGKDEVAKGGTEADRFERFLDEGFKVFKGEDVPLGGKPPGGKAGSGLSETTERPAGDDRSADDINDDHPVLDNLSSEDAKRLKFWFGDFDNDADAAYRAAAALENVKRYDSDGDPIYDEKDVLSDKIEKGDESDRLEELLDNGPGTLEGDGSWDDHHVTETTKRPPRRPPLG